MDTVDEFARLKVWNLYVIPVLEKVVKKMLAKKQQFAYMDYEFATDKRTKFRMLSRNLLKKRFINKSERGKDSYNNCMKDLEIDEDTIILVVFNYSQLYTFCPSLYKLNKNKIEEYIKPITIKYPYPYTINIWFRPEILIQMFEQINKKTILEQLNKLEGENILVIERNAAHNKLLINTTHIEQYLEGLALGLVHQDEIQRIEKMYNKHKHLIVFYCNNYLCCYFLLVIYNLKSNKFSYLTE